METAANVPTGQMFSTSPASRLSLTAATIPHFQVGRSSSCWCPSLLTPPWQQWLYSSALWGLWGHLLARSSRASRCACSRSVTVGELRAVTVPVRTWQPTAARALRESSSLVFTPETQQCSPHVSPVSLSVSLLLAAVQIARVIQRTCDL